MAEDAYTTSDNLISSVTKFNILNVTLLRQALWFGLG